ncbi:hypothetical protein GCM10009775_03040 [Microbacterium aoyamense]|uniref:Uncharacterized protein n=1 Tax=Microbacterium aoyamense TaxID=344166 RepID=A0ABP5AJR5_9MICO|nr:hypothetical protein [Microbacterium aoyamense]
MSASSVFVRDTPLFIESATGRLEKFPSNRWLRWGLRLIWALPFIAIAIWFNASSGGDWSGTANGVLAERVSSLPWGSSEVETLGQLYPPITSLIALVVPGGALGLAIVGCLVGGTMVQLVLQSLIRKGFVVPVRLVFVLTLALTPLWAYIVTTSFEATLGLTFFGLGMIDLVRFVTFANTQAGFRAGLLFAASAFSDSTGLFAALVAAAASTFIIRSRDGSRAANAIVVIFPTIAFLGSLMLLGVIFRVGPLAMIRGDLAWNAERAATVVAYLFSPSGLLYLAPTIVVIITALFLRFPGVGLTAVLLTGVTLIAFIVGLTPTGVAGINYTMMLLLAVAVVPLALTTRDRILTIATSVVLWGIGWAQAFDNATVRAWMGVLTGGAS